MNNVNLWYAKNDEGKMVTVDKLSDEYKGKYYCPLCGSEVIPKAIESESVSSHFAHIDKSKCSSESIVHWWVKHELIKEGDKFTIVTDKEEEYICKTIDIEKQYEIDDITYKPDATVITEDDKIIFIEINFTNKKKYKDYYEIWDKIGNTVIEFNAKEYLSEDSVVKINNNLKSVYYSGMIYKIDENSDDYIKYKKSILDKIEYFEYDDDILHELKWFIDDMYKYSCGIERDKDILSLGLDEISNMDYKYSEFIRDIYKLNKCSNVLKEIVEYRSTILINKIKNMALELELNNISFTCEQWKDKRLIHDRLFGDLKIELKYTVDKEGYEWECLEQYLNENNISVNNNSLFDDNNYDEIIVIDGLSDINIKKIRCCLKNIKNKLNNNELLFKKWNGIYKTLTKSNYEYIHEYNIFNYICDKHNVFDDIYNDAKSYIDGLYVYGHGSKSIGNFICKNGFLDKLTYEVIDGEKFVNVTKSNIQDIINAGIKYILNIKERINATKSLISANSLFVNELVNMKYDTIYGYTLVVGKCLIKIDNDNIVKYEKLRLTKIKDTSNNDFAKTIVNILELIYGDSGFAYSESQVGTLNEIRNLYKLKTDIRLKVVLDLDSFKLLNEFERVLSEVKISDVTDYKDLANKFSDDVRLHKYGVR